MIEISHVTVGIGVEKIPCPKLLSCKDGARCYHCHKKFADGNGAMKQCLQDHKSKTVYILRPTQSPYSSRVRYQTLHYDINPEMLKLDAASIISVTWKLQLCERSYSIVEPFIISQERIPKL